MSRFVIERGTATIKSIPALRREILAKLEKRPELKAACPLCQPELFDGALNAVPRIVYCARHDRRS